MKLLVVIFANNIDLLYIDYEYYYSKCLLFSKAKMIVFVKTWSKLGSLMFKENNAH